MPEVSSAARPQTQTPRFTLNSDGRKHPRQNGMTLFTLVAGLIAFALGLIVAAHAAAVILGGAAFAVGMYAQLNSDTTEQRILIVTGIIAAFVGGALGLGHGGF